MFSQDEPIFYDDRIYGAQLIDLTIEEYEFEEEPQLLLAFELCSEPGFVVTGTCDADLESDSKAQRWLSALSGDYQSMDLDELRRLIGSIAGIKISVFKTGIFVFHLVKDVVRSGDLELLAS